MTDERFNELVNGPLSHTLPTLRFQRISMALRAVVNATGEAGDRALEEHCDRLGEEDESEELRAEYRE